MKHNVNTREKPGEINLLLELAFILQTHTEKNNFIYFCEITNRYSSNCLKAAEYGPFPTKFIMFNITFHKSAKCVNNEAK